MKIGFISLSNPYNKQEWSGTPYYTFRTLSSYYQVDWICPKVRRYNISRLVTGLKARIFKSIEPFYHTKSFAKCLVHGLKYKDLDQYDLLFSIGSSVIAYLETNKPIIHMTDATYQQLIGYYEGYSPSDRYNRKANFVQRLAYKNSTYIIPASRWTADSIHDDYGIDINRIIPIKLGANIDTVPEFYEQKCLDSTQIHLLFIGKDWKRKGGQVAVDTKSELEKLGMKVSLVIIGSNPDLTLDQKKGCRIIPYIDKDNPIERQEFVSILKDSDFLILPTIAECAGIVFCEASAYGLPIMTSDTGGIPDYVENGVNGYRLNVSATGKEYADKIKAIIDDPQQYDTLTRNARKKFERELNWDAWLNHFKLVAKKALEGKAINNG